MIRCWHDRIPEIETSLKFELYRHVIPIGNQETNWVIIKMSIVVFV